MYKPLWSCLLEMGIASHYAGDKQVKRVAKSNLKKVARISRPVLQGIIKAEHPGRVVSMTLGNLKQEEAKQ